MPQELNSSQELTAGGGNTSTSGFSTGSKCTASGTFYTENKYLRQVIALGLNEIFPADSSGKKCTWYALTTIVSTSKTSDGGFTSVKVDAGTV